MKMYLSLWTEVSCWIITGERQAMRIRGLYLEAILRQDIEFFDTQTTTGEVIGRMSGDTIIIQEALGEKVGRFIQLATTFVGGFVIAFTRGWRLSLVICSCVPVVIVTVGCMSFTISKVMVRVQDAYAEAGDIVEQTAGAIRTVASFNGEKQAIRKYDEKLQIACSATSRQGLASGLGSGATLSVIWCSFALSIWYGSKLILQDDDYNGGKVINVMWAMMGGASAMGQASPCFSAFAEGTAAACKMFDTMERKPKINADDCNGITLDDINGEIELKDVHFRYPARPEVQIFSGFSFHIPSGKTAALVGQSGNGKSTVISLLERFYDPEAGEVLIDGINLKNFRLKWIRSKMALVSQEPILFTTTIRENITYGKGDASDEEIKAALKLANAAAFINKLPQGLDTMVGEHGTRLSGGQKQRIAIARAILKNPRIILLDEATSALDAESERVVQNALDTVMTNRTTVVVAHRLSTIRNADIIAVIHAGKLIEQGIHEELIKQPDGAYAHLVLMQSGRNHHDEEKRFAVDAEVGNMHKSLGLRSSVRMSSPSRISYVDPLSLINIQEIGTANDYEEETPRTNHEKGKRVSIKRLAYLNKPELPVLFLGSTAACVHGLLFPLYGLVTASAIKIFFEPPIKLRKDSTFWALMYVGIGFCSLIFVPVQSYFFGVAGGKLIQRIRSFSFQKIVHQEISWFDNPANSSGAVGARLATDASNVRSLVGDALALVVQNMATITGGIVIAFTANWILAFIILAVLPLLVLKGFIQMKFYKGFSADAKLMYEEASQVANDAVGSIRTVSSFGAEDKVMEMYKKKCEEPIKVAVKTGIVSGAGLGFGSFALFSTTSFCFYIGSILQEHGKASFAEIFRVFFALTTLATGISQTATLFPDLNKVRDSTASICEILDSKPKIDSSSEEGITLDLVKGDIELRHVSFKYPTRPDVHIFRDLSLAIQSGKTVALVGESGSGKSTIISLVERFYDPDLGHVYLDGIEIQKFKISWLRQQLGLVSQEPTLFNETISANIAYGRQGATTEEEIIEAAKASNAHNFISALPQGYNTNVGERGMQLSGGQKQRIAIARAILKDPKVLLLDEATSALDAESERIVQEALDKVMVGRTTIVVAHRLATIRGADMIAVVKNGVIAEKGRHDDLLDISGGLYASLVAYQMSYS